MLIRIKIEKKQFEEVYQELRLRGWTLNKISQKIGTNIKNSLYMGYTLNQESFIKLEKLFGRKIPHQEIQLESFESFEFPKKQQVAELAGIILGDGNIWIIKKKTGGNVYALNITISYNLNFDYINYVKSLMHSIFGDNFHSYDKPKQKIIELRIYSNKLLEELSKIGMHAGNKVENQVSVPNWIKKSEKFSIACLRGLVDTDGSIYSPKSRHQVYINFSNKSKLLLNDFKVMCRKLLIQTSGISSSNLYIYDQLNVKKFINTIKPFKWGQFLNRNKEYKDFLIE